MLLILFVLSGAVYLLSRCTQPSLSPPGKATEKTKPVWDEKLWQTLQNDSTFRLFLELSDTELIEKEFARIRANYSENDYEKCAKAQHEWLAVHTKRTLECTRTLFARYKNYSGAYPIRAKKERQKDRVVSARSYDRTVNLILVESVQDSVGTRCYSGSNWVWDPCVDWRLAWETACDFGQAMIYFDEIRRTLYENFREAPCGCPNIYIWCAIYYFQQSLPEQHFDYRFIDPYINHYPWVLLWSHLDRVSAGYSPAVMESYNILGDIVSFLPCRHYYLNYYTYSIGDAISDLLRYSREAYENMNIDPYTFYSNGCAHAGCIESESGLPLCPDCNNYPCACPLHVPLVEDSKYIFSASMNDEQRREIIRAIDSISPGTILDSFATKPVKIVIDPYYQHLASYNPVTNTMTFRSAYDIPSGHLIEELFHAYQDRYYPGGINQYAVNGESSVEFEAKVLKDILRGYNDGCGELLSTMTVDSDDEEAVDEYKTWLKEATHSFDETQPIDADLLYERYDEMIGYFHSNTANGYNSSTTENVYFEALLEVINN